MLGGILDSAIPELLRIAAAKAKLKIEPMALDAIPAVDVLQRMAAAAIVPGASFLRVTAETDGETALAFVVLTPRDNGKFRADSGMRNLLAQVAGK
jgi:hypothetical protein